MSFKKEILELTQVLISKNELVNYDAWSDKKEIGTILENVTEQQQPRFKEIFEIVFNNNRANLGAGWSMEWYAVLFALITREVIKQSNMYDSVINDFEKQNTVLKEQNKLLKQKIELLEGYEEVRRDKF